MKNIASLILCVTLAISVLHANSQSDLTYPIVDTGQLENYGNTRIIEPPQFNDPFYGQDAIYDGFQSSYQDNEDGTITDLVTGLVWQKTPPTEHFTWDEAFAYAKNLKLADNNDWRIPTIKELYSLAMFYGDMNTKTPYIDTTFFDFYYPDTSQGYRDMDAQYWSSNKYVGRTMRNDRSAFGYNFADGRIKSYPTGEGGGPTKDAYIRCVRGRTDYAINQFVDNEDQTITDLATGLMWMKQDSTETMLWQNALTYAEDLDFAGYTDWRLPNTKELHSIVDYTRAPFADDPAFQSAAIDPIFDLTETESWHWTGTTLNDDRGAIYIAFGQSLAYDSQTEEFSIDAHGAGAQRSDPKTGDPNDFPQGRGPQLDQVRIYNYTRCVRTADSTSSLQHWKLYK